MDIAFSDIVDYVDFGYEKVSLKSEYGIPLIDNDGNEIKVPRNYVRFKNSDEIDGSIITEVKQGKDGVSVKLNDRMKALEWLSKHMNIATEEERLKIKKMKNEIDKQDIDLTQQSQQVVFSGEDELKD